MFHTHHVVLIRTYLYFKWPLNPNFHFACCTSNIGWYHVNWYHIFWYYITNPKNTIWCNTIWCEAHKKKCPDSEWQHLLLGTTPLKNEHCRYREDGIERWPGAVFGFCLLCSHCSRQDALHVFPHGKVVFSIIPVNSFWGGNTDWPVIFRPFLLTDELAKSAVAINNDQSSHCHSLFSGRGLGQAPSSHQRIL